MDYPKLLSRLRRKPRVNGYVSPETETRSSPIHGLGLFAKMDLQKGALVAAWGGRMKTGAELRALPEHISFNYALRIGPDLYLAETSDAELDAADFINHSCEANCRIENVLVMVTKRKVRKG